MIRRWMSVLCLSAFAFVPAGAGADELPLPPLPHTVGMSGPDVDLIETGIAAYDGGDLTGARADFRKALAIRSQTAIANFNLGVTETRLGDRDAGARSMRRGFALANAHGMAASPQAQSMRAIAQRLGVVLH